MADKEKEEKEPTPTGPPRATRPEDKLVVVRLRRKRGSANVTVASIDGVETSVRGKRVVVHAGQQVALTEEEADAIQAGKVPGTMEWVEPLATEHTLTRDEAIVPPSTPGRTNRRSPVSEATGSGATNTDLDLTITTAPLPDSVLSASAASSPAPAAGSRATTGTASRSSATT